MYRCVTLSFRLFHWWFDRVVYQSCSRSLETNSCFASLARHIEVSRYKIWLCLFRKVCQTPFEQPRSCRFGRHNWTTWSQQTTSPFTILMRFVPDLCLLSLTHWMSTVVIFCIGKWNDTCWIPVHALLYRNENLQESFSCGLSSAVSHVCWWKRTCVYWCSELLG